MKLEPSTLYELYVTIINRCETFHDEFLVQFMLEIRKRGYKNISKLMEICSTFSLFIILFNRRDKVTFESNEIQFGENSLQKLKREVIMIAKNLREIIPFLHYFSHSMSIDHQREHRFFGKVSKKKNRAVSTSKDDAIELAIRVIRSIFFNLIRETIF